MGNVMDVHHAKNGLDDCTDMSWPRMRSSRARGDQAYKG